MSLKCSSEERCSSSRSQASRIPSRESLPGSRHVGGEESLDCAGGKKKKGESIGCVMQERRGAVSRGHRKRITLVGELGLARAPPIKEVGLRERKDRRPATRQKGGGTTGSVSRERRRG